jgi:signal transduction histidine kinase
LALAVKSAYLLADLAEALSKLQLAYRRTIDAEDEERRRLAMELHDDILSRLTTMTLALRHGQKQLSVNPEQVQGCLEMVEYETQSINRRLREITQGLHPSVLVDLGLISALQAYMDSLVKKSLPASAPGLITLTAQGFNGDRLAEPNLERDLYFITRQALDNAIEHAHADQVFIHLRWREDAVSVTVQDNGRVMKEPPEQLMGQNGRLGLLSMNERVLTWQGRLTFHTTPGNGTTVQVRVPIDQPSRQPAHLQAFTQLLHPDDVEPRIARKTDLPE